MRTDLIPDVEADVLSAALADTLPEDFWNVQDDLCDCVYQRIGMWTNPYLAETLEVRLCCIWAEFEKQHPQFVRRTHAYKDGNAQDWVTEPMDWNGEDEMPKAIWYRQLARKENRSVAEVRADYVSQDQLRPKGEPKREKNPFLVNVSGEWIPIGL